MNENQPMNLGLSRAEASERGFLSQVYFWMAMALALSGFSAWWMAMSPNLVIALMRNVGLFWLLAIAQIGIVFWLSSQVTRLSLMSATIGFSVYATLNGVLLSWILLVYTAASVASTFFITAGTFAIVSTYGFMTKRNLASLGNLCFMGLIGIILASLVNWFFKSPAVDCVISYLGVAIFVGLTAYDTQRLKSIHEAGFESQDALKKVAILGALALYLDFINLFLMLLRVLGRRK